MSVKAVSRCKHCNVIYNALPCNKEYGIGRFICPDEQCGNVFFGRCHAECKWKCYGCETVVSKPYIHPGNEHYQTESMCHGAHYCRKRECLLSRDSCARMLFTSTPHVSTGSTITGSQKHEGTIHSSCQFMTADLPSSALPMNLTTKAVTVPDLVVEV